MVISVYIVEHRYCFTFKGVFFKRNFMHKTYVKFLFCIKKINTLIW